MYVIQDYNVLENAVAAWDMASGRVTWRGCGGCGPRWASLGDLVIDVVVVGRAGYRWVMWRSMLVFGWSRMTEVGCEAYLAALPQLGSALVASPAIPSVVVLLRPSRGPD
ncbi:hypothetical protein FPV67DRAFT_1451020 [Lyophyllum atratum]|nr:hypothetical protein FPV67DRAFT_1451020 [Lyophyllum atratum]